MFWIATVFIACVIIFGFILPYVESKERMSYLDSIVERSAQETQRFMDELNAKDGE